MLTSSYRDRDRDAKDDRDDRDERDDRDRRENGANGDERKRKFKTNIQSDAHD